MDHFFDKACFQQLENFLCYGAALFISEASHCLSYWLGSRDYLQGMLGEFPGYTYHVRWLLCEDVPVLTEELDERAFLFGGQAYPY
jgi:hypothetical protein